MRAIALVSVLVACGASEKPMPPVPRDEPLQRDIVMRTSDGRILVEEHRVLWCYGNGIDDDADCMTEREACDAMRRDHVDFDTNRLVAT